jgi:hypothetical protein
MFSAIVMLSTSVNSPMPLSFMEADSFRLRHALRNPQISERGNAQSATFFNSTGEKIKINVRWISNSAQENLLKSSTLKAREEYLDSISTAEPYMKNLSSKLPPASARIFKGKTLGLIVINQQAEVSCFFTPQVATNPRGFADPQPFDFRTKSAILERIARHTLANAAGMRLDNSGTGALAGSTVARATCRRSGRVFGDLTQWAQAENWTLSEDSTYGFLTIKKGANWAVLPLGADQIKVKGVWKKMGDSAAYFNGKLYLPAAGLEHLRGA